MQEPQFNPPPEWVPLDFPRSFGKGRSFVSGEPEGDRLRVHYFRDPGRGGICALAWWGPGAEGPPGHAHGGSAAAVLDEVMGFSAWNAGHPVVAATITVNFKKGLPLGAIHVVRAQVDRVDGRKVFTSGQIESPDGTTVYSTADGVFIRQPHGDFGALVNLFADE